MSKKKNTLKDLDEFLKQQAATLVSPDKLKDQVQETKPTEQQEPSIAVEEKKIASTTVQPASEISTHTLIENLKLLSQKNGISLQHNLYSLIITSLESNKTSTPEDAMLINTVLYLKSGDNWKEVIKEYWSK